MAPRRSSRPIAPYDLNAQTTRATYRPSRAVQATLTTASLKSEMDAHIKALEEKLNRVGDDAQLANVDLQNVLQKQQQTLQMMSTVSKMLYDTAQSVIRKMGG